MSSSEHRRATRIAVNLPMLIETIGQPEIKLHKNLAEVYSRVSSNTPVGNRFPGTLRDLSTNGAFISGEAMPLLARVAFAFELDGFGRVEAVGWTLWRRAKDCEIPCEDAPPVVLPSGFGVLFEAIPLDARIAIHRMVDRAKPN